MSENPPCEELEQRILELEKSASECRLIEEALRESEAKFRFLTESMSDIVWTVDMDFNTTYVSPSIENLLGFTPEERINQSPEDMITPESLKSIRKQLKKEYIKERLRSKDQVRSITVMTEYYRKDGGTLWLENHVRWIYNEKGKITGIHGVSRDISKHRQAEEALRESEEHLKLALKGGDLGTWDWDIKTGRVEFNERWAEMKGFSIDEIEPNLSTWKKLVHSDDLPWIYEILNKHLEGKTDFYEAEFRMKHKSDGWIWILDRGKVIERDKKGNPLRVCGTNLDITDRKRVEEEKEKLKEELVQAQKMESVGQLAGGVAHDFNNMLCVILGNVEMLQEELPPDSSIQPGLKEIQKAALHSAEIVHQLLTFARKQTISPRVLDLNSTIETMLKMLRRLIGEGIKLSWHSGRDLWSVRVDPSQIEQILANLCVNAQDAIAGVGNLIIETDNAYFDENFCSDNHDFMPGEYVMMSISDDGCGMDKETIKNIFDPFFTTKEVGKGTGLGLSTVYGIVKQNNGFVNVYSELGYGTCIKVYLPRHTVRITSAPQKESREPAVRGSETILLVEDEPSILAITATMLERMGYTVLSTNIPGEAILLAREHAGNIHLLITDVVMPEMNGLDLAGKLISIYPDIRRLFMSGYTVNVITSRGVLDEGMHFIQKPFTSEKLAAKIREALDQPL